MDSWVEVKQIARVCIFTIIRVIIHEKMAHIDKRDGVHEKILNIVWANNDEEFFAHMRQNAWSDNKTHNTETHNNEIHNNETHNNETDDDYADRETDEEGYNKE